MLTATSIFAIILFINRLLKGTIDSLIHIPVPDDTMRLMTLQEFTPVVDAEVLHAVGHVVDPRH